MRGNSDLTAVLRHSAVDHIYRNKVAKIAVNRFDEQIRLVFVAAAHICPADLLPRHDLADAVCASELFNPLGIHAAEICVIRPRLLFLSTEKKRQTAVCRLNNSREHCH